MKTDLTSYIGWMLGKWHQNGIHSISREDMTQLETLYLAELQRGDDTEHAVLEFVGAMNSPRGQAHDQRRKDAMTKLRQAHAKISAGIMVQ